MSDIKVGDRVRRTEPCAFHGCDDPCHQVGWEGEVTSVSGSGLYLWFRGGRTGRADAYRKVATEDKDTPEAQPYLSAAPDPAIRLEVLKLALSYGALDLTDKKIVKVADEFAAWVEGR